MKWLASGGNLAALQEVLGHADLSTTARYAEVTQDLVNRDVCSETPTRHEAGRACVPNRVPSSDARAGAIAQLVARLVAPTGVEPVARGLGNRCSIRLSYGATGRGL